MTGSRRCAVDSFRNESSGPGGLCGSLSGGAGDPKGLVVSLAEERAGLGDAMCATGVQCDLAQSLPQLSECQAVHDPADHEWRERSMGAGHVEQPEEPHLFHGVPYRNAAWD